MIDTNKDCNTPHDTRPLLLATTFLPENVVKIWIQQTNNGCTTTGHKHKCRQVSRTQKNIKNPRDLDL